MLYQSEIKINELFNSDLPTNAFNERLKKARAMIGVSQESLAKLSGLCRSTIIN
ncbi:helix-turn-helix domain-containing protein [Clostridium paraputrificum]|uniref:helix-turn-helix domain-containing protein n=1 Tax=Clostridium paraputrificum TaxID=29363 RepID=UPI001899EF77|nr:helix-turn-helix transcriptional regulator [Clostridium paraputrificum]